MLNLKKIVSLILAVIVCLGITFCGGISAFADDYGTYEDGILANQNMANYKPLKDGKGFPNGDFEQGLKYWGTQRGKELPSSKVKLLEEDGNHFIEFAAEKNWDGIYSTTFSENRVGPDESVSALFKFRGDVNFQIVLIQLCLTADGKSYSERRLAIETKTLVIGTGADGWSVGLLDTTQKTVKPSDVDAKYDDPNMYFIYFVQVKTDSTVTTQIDDIQLVNYNKTSGTVTDLDGKQLYDMKNLPVNPELLENDDFGDYIEDEYDYTLEKETKKSEGKTADGNFLSKYLWVIIAAGVVIVVAAAAAVIIVLKKKNTPDNAVETLKTTEDIAEEKTEEQG